MNHANATLSRRSFVKASALASGVAVLAPSVFAAANKTNVLSTTDLPKGNSPQPVAMPHFPSRVHAFVWRNWSLVPAETMARVLGSTRDEVVRLGRSMGLPKPPRITREQQRRSYISVIKRNWHLLPYEQLLALLDWTPEQMAFVLREDDFLYIKLGNLKPKCAPLKFADATSETLAHVANVLRDEFPKGLPAQEEELFEFVTDLSRSPERVRRMDRGNDTPRFCYSYFALYGDPLLDRDLDPYPDGYLERLANAGVNGVWLQAVLFKLAPFPWDESLSARHDERIRALSKLVTRARKHGIGIYLYLNEPRSMPLKFFASRPELKGVTEGDHAALCTTNPDVQRWMKNSIARICREVPALAGFFTITASENLTNCWSHGAGKHCARCAQRPAADVIAEVNSLVSAGIEAAGSNARLFAWDWGWNDAWASDAIRKLPLRAALMSVSEWSLPIERGGVKTTVGEYSISAVGPGPRAKKHWQVARERGLKTLAKIQAGNTWELSAVPYIPAVANVARHAANLREAGVDGLMLGWTLGGYPSPNLEVVSEISDTGASPDEAMRRVAERRFGSSAAPHIVTAWKEFSSAFSEFPYHISVVYSAPLQLGPANLLFEKATGYTASMVGFPYDHLDGWRGVYPAEVFIAQLEKVASGFDSALAKLGTAMRAAELSRSQRRETERELVVSEAAAIHFRSVANQARFVRARNSLSKSPDRTQLIAQLEKTLRDELELARRLLATQSRDARIGFEATNQYYYVREDLLEKVINCRDLLDRWLPSLGA